MQLSFRIFSGRFPSSAPAGLLAFVLLALANAGCSSSAPPPKEPEPAQAKVDPNDVDGDGFVTAVDKCPAKKEDGRAPDPKDGCPTDDPDGDGVRGVSDDCPTEAEVFNGIADEDGCPVDPKAEMLGDELIIHDKIHFAVGSSRILPRSDHLLRELARIISRHPEVELLEVGGHADERGGDKLNDSLTNKRAKAVRERLVKLGINPKRLEAHGYGAHCPRADAPNEEAYRRNRRVEFHVLRRDHHAISSAGSACPNRR